ncbi:MAG: hypothetical protein ACRC5U_11255, partial [Plesiomonas sp.]
MTDHKPQSSPAADEQATSTSTPHTESAITADSSKTAAPQAPAKTETTAKSGQTLGAIAIALVIALGGGLYYHGHQQSVTQNGELAQMQQKVDTLTNALTESLANQKKLASEMSS